MSFISSTSSTKPLTTIARLRQASHHLTYFNMSRKSQTSLARPDRASS
ncbi:hypothetical protein JMJ77_0010751 [Colletotrichum scovillei]|uniref:Uncharacterized protein n=1 Tax=Colletotrichum scovillei TaxID=1209932 RepID=A0A9P7R392_9PEZI|nr:hypothetical protein JMJ77_0010751 [Colletotrichum scovillei]KAG7059744.1 hypothetical protein JMJ78_0015033 [Colletotrichum scovillei]KAG7067164.1 hypothetical protein JMJ76_0008607 [Colletotrichum scovillei]